jgi:hypothetical protein
LEIIAHLKLTKKSWPHAFSVKTLPIDVSHTETSPSESPTIARELSDVSRIASGSERFRAVELLTSSGSGTPTQRRPPSVKKAINEDKGKGANAEMVLCPSRPENERRPVESSHVVKMPRTPPQMTSPLRRIWLER